jgi:site-specific recombinase XerC
MNDDTAIQVPPKRGRGRPPGRKAVVVAQQSLLRHHHFSFLRAALEIDLSDAWVRYMSFAGGSTDRRHYAHGLAELRRGVLQAASLAGLGKLARVALFDRDDAGAPPASAGPASTSAIALLPPLDEWVASRCGALGVDYDFQTQADWLAEYQAEFGLDQQAPAVAATGLPDDDEDAPPSLVEQLHALRELGTALAQPPGLLDPLVSWLSAGLARQLRSSGIVTLANLIDYVNTHRYRWYERVGGLGEARASRIIEWLQPIGEHLQRPLRPEVLRKEALNTLAREAALARLDPLSVQRYAIVPLERLAVPPELSGRHGQFRLAHQPNVLGADDDMEAIQKWLQRFSMTPRTYTSYGREVERFYLWCIRQRRKALSDVIEEDLHAFRAFIADPPPEWIQNRKALRISEEWRPFRGKLSPSSQRHTMTIVATMLSALVEAGYLSANAARGVKPYLKLPRATVNNRRAFTEAQWKVVMQVVGALPDNPFNRRTRLVLELGATSGLRLIEICTTRIGALREEAFNGDPPTWMLDVMGKGSRARRVPVYEDIKDMIYAHQADLVAAGTVFDPAVPTLRTLLSVPAADTALGVPVLPVAAAAKAKPDPDQRPLVGALRKPPPRWKAGSNGVPVLDRKDRRHADQYGALNPTALYESLKRVFKKAARRIEEEGLPERDAKQLLKASTHWLRHFFGNNAGADGVNQMALMRAMGHSDPRTTAIYTQAEDAHVASELAKVRRR